MLHTSKNSRVLSETKHPELSDVPEKGKQY